MGKIKYTGQQKAFEGTAGSIPDNQSIQLAVKGTRTVGEQSSVTKNMLTIAGLSYLDMFDPKRTTQPIDMATYRGFPILTINALNFDGLVFPITGGYEGYINFTLNSNTRRVGYPYRLFVQAWSGDGFTPPGEPDSPAPSDNYAETVINVTAGTVLNQTIQLNFDEIIVDVFSEVAEFTLRVNYLDDPWGAGMLSNQFYFNVGFTETKNTFGEHQFTVAPVSNSDPYPYQHVLLPLDGSTCNSVVTGEQLTVFSDSANLSAGGLISTASNVMTPISAGFYSFQNSSTFYVLTVSLSGSDSFVSNITNCGSTPPIIP
jgi:hypothetical protein